MLPIKLQVKNFTSYKDETIHFNKFGSPTIICGDNGNGKSSIIDMITTVLYFHARGTDSRGAGIDDLITKDAKKMEISFTFEMNNNIYKIIRTKVRNGQHGLKFSINGIEQASSIKETQNLINSILKMDYDTFMDTVCIAQGNSGSFMNKTPDKRKEIFSQILNLDEYGKYEKLAKQKKSEINLNLQQIQLELDSKQSLISKESIYKEKLVALNLRLETISDSINILNKEIELEMKEQTIYETEQKQKQQLINQRNQLRKQVEQLSEKESSYMKKVASLNQTISAYIKEDYFPLEKNIIENKQRIDKLQNEKDIIQQDISSSLTKISIIKEQLNELKKKMNRIEAHEEGYCENCGQVITAEYKQKYISQLKTDGNTHFRTAKQLKSSAEEKKIRVNQLQLQIQTLQKKNNDLQTRIFEMKQKAIRNEETLKTISAYQDIVAQTSKDLLLTKNNYEQNLSLGELIFVPKTFHVNEKKSKLNTLQIQQRSINSDIAICNDRLNQIIKAKDEYKLLQERYNKLEETKEDYEALVHAFSKSGIPSYIIENSLASIQIEINEILDVLTNGKISMEFIVEKEKKSSKGTMDTLEIMVNDNGIQRKYETYSGGEKFRIDFSCHVGLSRFLAKRAGASIDLFILDENLGSQDETAKMIFIQCINQLTNYFKKILIITHINDIKDAFVNKVLVEKDLIHGSKVKLI